MKPTKSFRPAPPASRFQHLAGGASVYDIADRSRAAAFAFLEGTSRGWSRKELALWLVGPYRDATASTTEMALAAHTSAPPSGRSVDESTVERLLYRTRERVIDMLVDCTTSWTSEGFAGEMIDGGLVVGIEDEVGALGYAPVEVPEMRLVDRVISLLVADYLTRPGDYHKLIVCEHCGEASLDWSCHPVWCGIASPTESGVREKFVMPGSKGYTITGLGD